MGKLIYSITTSLDGYVADERDNFEWATPSEEVHAFINNVVRNVGTFLLGRRMYEILAVWDTIRDTDSNAMNHFADIWRAANKVVYSTSLTEVSTANTTIEHVFDAEEVHRLVTESDKDFGIGGPHLAAEAIRAGIVDDIHQIIVPIIIGGGNYWLPKKVEAELQLVEVQNFENGFVHLQYKSDSSLRPYSSER
jgi:dihydrofolate reductase